MSYVSENFSSGRSESPIAAAKINFILTVQWGEMVAITFAEGAR
ncbi:hypothetical protein NIES2104_13730 [Leptolyngbya sp. NIES-2104]|nr:hypothetical protein NIES2104_13730 [Leptolyngbya sp. NIES-2104]